MKNFWRSYSFVLTVVFLLSVSFVSVSAATSDVNIYSIGTSAKSTLATAFSDGLRAYFGRYSGSYSVAGPITASGSSTSISASASNGFVRFLAELTNAVNQTINGTTRDVQRLDTKLGYLTKGMSSSKGLIDILSSQSTTVDIDVSGIIRAIDADGEQDLAYFKSLVSGFSRNHTDLTSGFSINHTDLTSGFSTNHTDLTSGFSTNHTDLTSGFSTNHADLEAVRRQIMNSFSEQDTIYLYGYAQSNGLSSLGVGSYVIGSDGKAGYTPWNSSSGDYASFTGGYGLGGLIGQLGIPMQYDLAKLRYVLASDQDIEISKKNEPVKDAIENNFVGDAPGAVKPDSVGDMAGISGGLQDSLNTGANAGDVLGFLNGSEGWGFWSQEVANGLHNVPASTADDEVSIYYGDIDSFEDLSFEDFAGIDFIHFYDPSALDDYLSRGDVS